MEEIAGAARAVLRRPAWQRIADGWAQLRCGRSQRLLRVSERLDLGEKRQLLIVECGARRILLGAAGNFMATLAELGEGDAEKTGE